VTEEERPPESNPDDAAPPAEPEGESQADETAAPPPSEVDSEQTPAEPEAEETAEAPAPSAEEPAAPPEPAPPAEEPTEAPEPVAQAQEPEEYEPTPREKPEIPGADLIPDLAPEEDEFLDAEAQAAAEAEAEALAAAADADEPESQPIADAAIDLAAGARYTATGKRKTAVARVILKPGTGTYLINDKPLDVFFPRETLRRVIRQPLEAVGYDSRMDVVARMHGGGVSAQAGALRHGISRALIVADPHLRGELKRRGFLTRDPRVKERKKAGLKKARKRPQFSKR
jgi:small subunit ribosomal protein S9